VFVGAYFDLPAATGILKELYDGQIVENEVYKRNPFYTMVQKKTNFYGKNRPIPLAYGVPQGRSSTFSNAQGNQSPTQLAEFLLTRKRDYALATIDNETREAAGTDKGAFVDALTIEVDPAIQSITMSLASALFRSGSGSIGQVNASGLTSGVITLSDPTSVAQFEVNMVLQANATDGGASPRAALGYVIAVDRIASTVTVASTGFGGAAATPTSWSASDFLVVQGDNNMKVSGLPAWLLSSAPSGSDNFYGVNRSADRWRLAGGYFNGANEAIEEALIDGAMLLGREGGVPDMVFTNYVSYGALDKSLGSKVQYTELTAESGDGTIAFEGIKINGPYGKMTILPDRNCPQTKAFMLQMRDWTLHSLGEAPKILEYEDNNKLLRVTNADAMECRVGYYANLGCRAPGWSLNLDLSQ
jgi:hypothetical protein